MKTDTTFPLHASQPGRHLSQSLSQPEQQAPNFAAILAERIAQAASSAAEQAKPVNDSAAVDPRSATDTRDDLLNLLRMTPAERIRHALLQEMGLTEESLRNLPPEERMRIEELIKQEIKRQLAGQNEGSEAGGPQVFTAQI